MSEHTKEPWFVADWSNDSGNDLTTIEAREPEELFDGQSHIWPDGIAKKKVADTSEGANPLEDARRIVACVNACQRLNTELLERVTKNGGFGLHPRPQERIEELEQQRDNYKSRALKSRALMYERTNAEQAAMLNKVIAEREELLAALEKMIARFDRFEVPFTLAELRRQVAAIAKSEP